MKVYIIFNWQHNMLNLGFLFDNLHDAIIIYYYLQHELDCTCLKLWPEQITGRKYDKNTKKNN